MRPTRRQTVTGEDDGIAGSVDRGVRKRCAEYRFFEVESLGEPFLRIGHGNPA